MATLVPSVSGASSAGVTVSWAPRVMPCSASSVGDRGRRGGDGDRTRLCRRSGWRCAGWRRSGRSRPAGSRGHGRRTARSRRCPGRAGRARPRPWWRWSRPAGSAPSIVRVSSRPRLSEIWLPSVISASAAGASTSCSPAVRPAAASAPATDPDSVLDLRGLPVDGDAHDLRHPDDGAADDRADQHHGGGGRQQRTAPAGPGGCGGGQVPAAWTGRRSCRWRASIGSCRVTVLQYLLVPSRGHRCLRRAVRAPAGDVPGSHSERYVRSAVIADRTRNRHRLGLPHPGGYHRIITERHSDRHHAGASMSERTGAATSHDAIVTRR